MPKLKEYRDHSCDYDSTKTELFTTDELATKLKISVKTLASLRMRGEGPAYFKISEGKGGTIVYDWRDVAVYLKSHKRISTSDTGGKK